MDVDKCFDCGVDNSVTKTGSFLCDECRGKEFARLRQLVKGEQEMKTNREIVVELSKKGLKPKEISEKTGIPVKTVYNYRHFSKDEIESDSKPKEKEVSIDNDDYKKLQLEHNKLKEEKEGILVELDNYKYFYEQEIRLLQKENDSLIEQLNEEKAKYEQLKELYKNLENKLEHEKKMAKRLSENFIREQEKHDVLLKYLVMSNEQYARYKFP